MDALNFALYAIFWVLLFVFLLRFVGWTKAAIPSAMQRVVNYYKKPKAVSEIIISYYAAALLVTPIAGTVLGQNWWVGLEALIAASAVPVFVIFGFWKGYKAYKEHGW